MSVKEADGSISRYLVPYSSVPNMLQSGVSKYDFAAGRSHIEGAGNQYDFLQGSYQYGLNNLLTVYGGTMLSQNYNSFVLGTGWNTPIGAVSIDATRSHSEQDNGDVLMVRATGCVEQICHTDWNAVRAGSLSLFLAGLSYL